MRKLSARWGLLASRRISVFSSLIHIVITSKEGSRKEDVEKKSSLLFLDKYRIFTTIQTVKVKRYLKRWTRSLRIRNHAKLSDFRKITWNELRKLLRLRRNNCEMHIFTFYIRKFNWTKQCRIGKEKIWDEWTDYQIIKRSVIDQRSRATNRSSRGKEWSYRRSHFLVSTSIRRVRVFPRFCPRRDDAK